MWPFNLSVRLPIVDMVGRYLAIYLIGRELIFDQYIFGSKVMRLRCVMRY